jgi:divalent metal cation (Fe/Co/Zn/Cd) transporter
VSLSRDDSRLTVLVALAVPARMSVEDAGRLAVGAARRMRRAEPSVGQVYLRFDPDGDAPNGDRDA